MSNQKNISVVRESNTGLWFWKLPDGELLQDGHGNYFNMPGHRYSIAARKKMREAVRSLGIEGGEPFFKQNERRVTQSEWEDQMARNLEGKIPDWHDPAIYEQARDRGDRR